MYICKDCGKKYTTQQEYCDCGNNTFDYIEEVTSSVPIKPQGLSIEQKAQILSWCFFWVCFFVSVIVWIIPVKTQPSSVQNTVVEEKQTIISKNIPSIDKIWDDTPVAVPKTVVKEEPIKEPETIQEKLIAKLNTAPVHPKETVSKIQPVVQKPVVQQPKQNVQKSEVKPKTQTTSPINSQNKNVSKPVQNVSKPVQAKPTQSQTNHVQNISKPITHTDVSESKKTVPQTNKQPQSSATPQEKSQTVQKPTYNPNSAEMLRYKGNLRSAMFSKLPIGSIQGSGTCSVKFGIDSTGKLVNRNFVVKSDNTSLNNAVYYMMMSVPRFTPPPEGYNGETIIMNFKFNNGGYEISIY